jgi:outer membrane receptor for ferrienterochelin and colicins
MESLRDARHVRPKTVVALWTFVSALHLASTARAADDDALAALLDEHIVSGASKTGELAKDAPATTSVITSEEITRYGIRSLAEAIDFLGMGLITQDPLHSTEVGGRGVLLTADFGNHVLLVVDGHVFNEPWDGTAYFEQAAGIPLEMIDHIELILGPGSVLYGGNAMISVINIVTKRDASNQGLHLIASGGVSPQQGRNGNFTSFAPGDLGGSFRLGAVLGQKLPFGEHSSLDVGAELYRQSGPSFEWGPQRVTNDDGSPFNFGPRTQPGIWAGRIEHQYQTLVPTFYSRLQLGDLAVMFRAELYRRKTPVAGFDQQNSDFDEGRSWEQDHWVSLDAQYNERISSKLNLSVRGYADAYEYYQQTYNTEPSVCAVPTNGPCLYEVNGHSRWVGAELQASYDWTDEDRYTTLIGLNGTLRAVGSQTASLGALSSDDFDGLQAQYGGGSDSSAFDAVELMGVQGKKDVTEVVRAAYIQQRLRPLNFLHLNLGARYDADPRGGNRISPRAAAALDAWEGGVLKLIYAEAFRPPTFFEALYTSPDYEPNPSLRSEYVRGVESTFEQRFGRNKFLVGFFFTHWNDMVSAQTLADGKLQYDNISTIENYGFNSSFQGALGSLHYGASLVGAHTRRKTPDGDQRLPVAPQFFGNARVSYALPDTLPTLALASTFVGRRPADRFLDGNFSPPPYAPPSAQFRLTLSQQIVAVPGLSYQVSGSYTTGNVVPYVAGPIQYYDSGAADRGPAELTHVVKLVAFATVRYDLPL